MTEGNPLGLNSIQDANYTIGGDPGMTGGGTYTNPTTNSMQPSLQDYENIFGPAGRDVKTDLQRSKRHSRWHLPDALKGVNPWLTDRIDGLITDATNSPFTTYILPYKYIDQVDAKIKWNVWSFDEGLASRVPYESAARTLTQTKRSYAGYTVRQGLAITMEHNFMMSEKGRQNFQHQLQQVVGSIQYTNDIDVHVALVTAPSHARHMAEKYYTQSKTNHQVVREYVDLFGFMSKNTNAMDIMIEEAKSTLKQWGSPDPTFLLTNSRLTFQMTMLPDKTQYLTQGIDGVKRLKTGPDIKSYRGLQIINSRMMSMEDGAPPRDILRRRVRVAEYYRIPYEEGVRDRSFAFYDESKDSWQKFSWDQLYQLSRISGAAGSDDGYVTTAIPHLRYQFRVHQEMTDVLQRANKFRASLHGRTADFVAFLNHFMGGLIYQPADLAFAEDVVFSLSDLHSYLFGRTSGLDEEQKRLFAIVARTLDRLPPTGSIAIPGPSATIMEEGESEVVTEEPSMLGSTSGPPPSIPVAPIPFWGSLASILPNVFPPFINQVIEAEFKAVEDKITFDVAYAVQKVPDADFELVVIRPNIEHNMLGIIMGRGGIDDLGATLWGQTELSVYDDSMHGIWGMSYKYNERAIVYNEKNLIRLWDVAYDGYNGGKDCRAVKWDDGASGDDHNGQQAFQEATYNVNQPYEGPSMMVMAFPANPAGDVWPSPIVFYEPDLATVSTNVPLDAEHSMHVNTDNFRVFHQGHYKKEYGRYHSLMPDFSRLHNPKMAGLASQENETSINVLAFQGTYKVYDKNMPIYEVTGNGHHGPDYVGVASVRSGKGLRVSYDQVHAARIV